MTEHKYTKIAIKDIKPYARNARTHSTEQVKQIMNAIKEWGFTNPLLIDEQNNLIAGHGRLEAVKQLNKVDFKNEPILELPAIVISGLDENSKRALIIADNQIALNAGWDNEVLALELKELESVNFDFSLLAFDNVDEILSGILDNENSNGGGQEIKEVEINRKYELLIKCQDENELEKVYNENIAKGYECKVLTF